MRVHRVVTTPFPGLAALAELVDPAHPEDLEELIALRSESDDAARAIALDAVATVAPRDRYTGPHAAIVMAPFLWQAPSRFSPGTYGVLYTAERERTAIAESAYHAARIVAASHGAPPGRLPRLAVTLELDLRRHDDLRRAHARAPFDERIYDPDDYRTAQAVGAAARAARREGIRYDSVRDAGGACCATFRPAAVREVGDDATTLELRWDGTRVTGYDVIESFAL